MKSILRALRSSALFVFVFAGIAPIGAQEGDGTIRRPYSGRNSSKTGARAVPTTFERTARPGGTDAGTAEDADSSGGVDGATGDGTYEDVGEQASDAPSAAAGLRSFVKDNYGWILAILGVGLLGVLSWIFLGTRVKSGSEPFLEPLDEAERPSSSPGGRYSSTRIRASDVNSRLKGAVTEEEVETDREYALVVEEGALKKSELDERTGRVYADERGIRERLRAQDLPGAYRAYVEIVAEDESAEFHGDVERALGEHFLRGRDYATAARILERHVATHAVEDVESNVYFNLGYIHFQTKTINKSRRFFKLFVETDRRPDYVARAQRILQTLGDGVGQN